MLANAIASIQNTTTLTDLTPGTCLRCVAYSRRRMAAPDWIPASAAMTARPAPSLRRQHHHHLAAFHQRLRLDLGDRRGLGLHALEQTKADVLVSHFTAAETQGDPDLVAFLEETAHGAHLHFVIVIVDARPQLDLFDLDDLLTLTLLGRLLLLEEAEFAEIENFADRRARVGDDLHEIQRGVFRQLDGIREIRHAAIVALGVYELDLDGANIAINPRAAFLRRRDGLHGTTNWLSPQIVATVAD